MGYAAYRCYCAEFPSQKKKKKKECLLDKYARNERPLNYWGVFHGEANAEDSAQKECIVGDGQLGMVFLL